MFLSGPGGVGKSHTIHAIYQSVICVLRQPDDTDEHPTCNLSVSIGKAAANINGTIVHSAFKLPIKGKRKRFLFCWLL